MYFLFAQLGMLCFGGVITTVTANQEGLFYLMNFNDFGMSMITLFHLNIVNNWFVTCNMFCRVMGTSWPRVFFIGWWSIAVLVMMNLVISFVMDIYSGVNNDITAEYKRREYVLSLKAKYAGRESVASSYTMSTELQ